MRYGAKAFLTAEGDKYNEWLGTAQVPKGNVIEFLESTADSCQLPPDPADAIKLLNIHWEVKALTRKEFDQLHAKFMLVLTQYLSTVRERSNYYLEKNRSGGGVDASEYVIEYDNSW